MTKKRDEKKPQRSRGDWLPRNVDEMFRDPYLSEIFVGLMHALVRRGHTQEQAAVEILNVDGDYEIARVNALVRTYRRHKRDWYAQGEPDGFVRVSDERLDEVLGHFRAELRAFSGK